MAEGGEVLVECDSGEVLVDFDSEVEEIPPATFAVGDSFASFQELEVKLKQYEKSRFVQLWKRDSRTVETARKRLTKPLGDCIKYYEVVYCCIHGGKNFKSKGEGKRSCSTFRKSCPAMISFRASEDGFHLVVRSINEEHNHDVSRELFKRLPQQRKLSSSEQLEARDLLCLKANKKMVRDRLAETTGKAIILKDLTNIKSAMNASHTRNDLDAAVTRLVNKFGATVEVVVGESDLLHGICFQDKDMRDVFRAYPEIVFIDATYKLLEVRFPVYVILAEYGKKHNPKWELIRVIMSDKDMTEREVFASSFPAAELLICLFHTFRSF